MSGSVIGSNVFEWGPFLTEREWGTVREDLSSNGDSWNASTYESANACDYFGGQDGLLGVCHKTGKLCLAASFWNGRDKLVKQRLFGLSGPEGNHSEDAKEYYAYGLCSPGYRYYDAYYRLAQTEFPIGSLRTANAKRSVDEPEFELEQTGIFDTNRFWDVHIEYAAETNSESPNLLVRITLKNCANVEAEVTVAPRVWLAYGAEKDGSLRKDSDSRVCADHPEVGHHTFVFYNVSGLAPLNPDVVCVSSRETKSWKRAIDECIMHPSRLKKISRSQGTASAAIYRCKCAPRDEVRIRIHCTLQPSDYSCQSESPNADVFDEVLEVRRKETIAYFDSLLGNILAKRDRLLCRAAYSLTLWNQQLYSYCPQRYVSEVRHRSRIRRRWLPLCFGFNFPNRSKLVRLRNEDWPEFNVHAVLGVPDRWEFPWFALWDLCLQLRVLVDVDPFMAQGQLRTVLSAMMRSDGALPGCEYNLSDQNPPLVAWAVLHLYRSLRNFGDRDGIMATMMDFFTSLRRNFDWWLEQSCASSGSLSDLFACGFLGLDNVSLFDRSAAHHTLPSNCIFAQVDATAWVCFYALQMREIAAILERSDVSTISAKQKQEFCTLKSFYEATFERVRAQLLKQLHDDSDNFFYDTVFIHNTVDKRKEPVARIRLRIRSAVGLIPLLCTAVDAESNRLLSVLPVEDFQRFVDRYLFNESELLGKFGIRSVSRVHADAQSVSLHVESMLGGSVVDDCATDVLHNLQQLADKFRYAPAESDGRIFGGNSNWRGPVWICINYLLLESLHRLQLFGLRRVSCDNTQAFTSDLTQRLSSLFDQESNRRHFYHDESESQHVLFHEFYDPDSGRGCGASFQSWTALIACAIRALHDQNYAQLHCDSGL